MTPEINSRLMALEAEFNAALDMLHNQFIKDLNRMARSFGQRTRIDRRVKNGGGLSTELWGLTRVYRGRSHTSDGL